MNRDRKKFREFNDLIQDWRKGFVQFNSVSKALYKQILEQILRDESHAGTIQNKDKPHPQKDLARQLARKSPGAGWQTVLGSDVSLLAFATGVRGLHGFFTSVFVSTLYYTKAKRSTIPKRSEVPYQSEVRYYTKANLYARSGRLASLEAGSRCEIKGVMALSGWRRTTRLSRGSTSVSRRRPPAVQRAGALKETAEDSNTGGCRRLARGISMRRQTLLSGQPQVGRPGDQPNLRLAAGGFPPLKRGNSYKEPDLSCIANTANNLTEERALKKKNVLRRPVVNTIHFKDHGISSSLSTLNHSYDHTVQILGYYKDGWLVYIGTAKFALLFRIKMAFKVHLCIQHKDVRFPRRHPATQNYAASSAHNVHCKRGNTQIASILAGSLSVMHTARRSKACGVSRTNWMVAGEWERIQKLAERGIHAAGNIKRLSEERLSTLSVQTPIKFMKTDKHRAILPTNRSMHKTQRTKNQLAQSELSHTNVSTAQQLTNCNPRRLSLSVDCGNAAISRRQLPGFTGPDAPNDEVTTGYALLDVSIRKCIARPLSCVQLSFRCNTRVKAVRGNKSAFESPAYDLLACTKIDIVNENVDRKIEAVSELMNNKIRIWTRKLTVRDNVNERLDSVEYKVDQEVSAVKQKRQEFLQQQEKRHSASGEELRSTPAEPAKLDYIQQDAILSNWNHKLLSWACLGYKLPKNKYVSGNNFGTRAPNGASARFIPPWTSQTNSDRVSPHENRTIKRRRPTARWRKISHIMKKRYDVCKCNLTCAHFTDAIRYNEMQRQDTQILRHPRPESTMSASPRRLHARCARGAEGKGGGEEKYYTRATCRFRNSSLVLSSPGLAGEFMRTELSCDSTCPVRSHLSHNPKDGRGFDTDQNISYLQRGGRAVSPLASHQGEPGSIPGRVTGFSHVGMVPDDAVGRRVFSVISRFPRNFIPAILHKKLNHHHRLSRPR
ncbi:hypothetical protein PR048_008074 [Dryococelus australis]|uniref:Uncharacterized protein n=1 Tax=Dryococelus australis TaxID=614101 RepID=A0ABQ9HW33_9NEOP|nr:hypothetical protein PR048_008074 [Dryococelus australis]